MSETKAVTWEPARLTQIWWGEREISFLRLAQD